MPIGVGTPRRFTGTKLRDGGQRCDIWSLRAAHHRSCPILWHFLRDGERICRPFHGECLLSLCGPERSRLKEAARHHRLAVTNRFSLGGALGENPTVRPGAIADGQFRASASSDSIVSDCVVRTARETKFYSPPPPRTGGSSQSFERCRSTCPRAGMTDLKKSAPITGRS